MAQLKVKQISDFVSAVEGKINGIVGTANVTAIGDAKSEAISTAVSADVVVKSQAISAAVSADVVVKSQAISTAVSADVVVKSEAISTAVSADVVVLSSAKKYADDQDVIALNAAKAYSDIQKDRINALLLNSSETLDTFAEIKSFIDELDTADVAGLSAALSTAVSNDAVHASGISANAADIAALESTVGDLNFTVNLSKEADATTNTVKNSNGTDATLSSATEELAGLMTADNFRKLSTILEGADVTDLASVRAAGALMDDEITNLSQVKAFASSDYATASQGALADSALQDAGAFDASGSADAAKTAANEYTDGFISALGTAAYNATGDFATAAQGAKADSALQNADAFDAAGSATAAQTAAEATAKTYTDTRETSILSTLRGEISAVAGTDKVEQIATFADITRFNLTTKLSLDNNDILVFVNGLQIHKASEGIDGFTSADGRAFVVSGLGYDLEANDHIVVVGVADAAE
jgi:hypothetical protein